MRFAEGETAGHLHDGGGRWYLDRVFCTRRLARDCGSGSAGIGLSGGIDAQNLPVSETLKIWIWHTLG